MAETITIARPYARAAFEMAASGADFDGWSAQLGAIARVVQDAAMGTFLDDPDVGIDAKCQALIDVCGDALSEPGRNFVRLLAEHRRLAMAPVILQVYEHLRAEAQSTVEAEVTTAHALSDTQHKELSEALRRRLNRDVVLKCTVDESLLGGAIIRAGDLVIDGSVQGKLDQLASTLSQ